MLLNKTTLALANLASKDESRYTLQAIAVEKDVAVVTQGHYLVAVTHAPMSERDFPETPNLKHRMVAEGETVLVSRDAAIAASKAIAKKTTIPVLTRAALGEDNTLYVNQLDSVQSFKCEQGGKFPTWRAVMPKGEPVAEIVLQAEYLELLSRFVVQHGAGRQKSIRLTLYGPTNAIRFDAKSVDDQDITMVLMPLKDTNFAKRPDELAKEAKAVADVDVQEQIEEPVAQ